MTGLGAMLAGPSMAQADYPSRPATVVVAFPPGSPAVAVGYDFIRWVVRIKRRFNKALQ